MDTFTEAYQKSLKLLKTKCFDPRWSDLEARIKVLFAAAGPNAAEAAVLDLIRARLAAQKKDTSDDAWSAYSESDEIIDLSRPDVAGFQDRAALLDMLRNFYLVQQAGNQRVWVLDGAAGIERWMYDELSGNTKDDMRRKLAANVFEAMGPSIRRMLPEALQVARKWSMDVAGRLSAPDAETTAAVKRWFLIGDPGAGKVRRTTATLLSGFKKIAAMSNAADIIFSDDPPHRKRDAERGEIRIAAVDRTDKMVVIYIYPAFFKSAKRNKLGQYPKMWEAANALIHEFSHRALKTLDVYETKYHGLKPREQFPPADAIQSADSWAYFATNLVGELPKEILSNALD
ncbi:MAG: hypothetical protein V7604_3645 [Hyphomicrobiales bacterium]|jgi:hypothetical protein